MAGNVFDATPVPKMMMGVMLLACTSGGGVVRRETQLEGVVERKEFHA